MKKIRFDWSREERVKAAKVFLAKYLSLKNEYILFLGLGYEGVVFRVGEVAFKVFDGFEESSWPKFAELRLKPD